MRTVIVAFTIISCLCTALMAQAQPPGPASKLLMINSIDEDVVFTVETGSQSSLFVINQGSSFISPLRKTTDDRVIYASKAGQGGAIFAAPFKVYDTSQFNASEWPADTVVAALVRDPEGDNAIIYALAGPGELKPLPKASPEAARALERHEKAIKKAQGRTQKEAQVAP